MRADADKRGNTVDAGGAGAACSRSTIVDVFWAVEAAPAVNAHADVAADEVAAGAAVLACVWLQTTFIHILRTVLTCEHTE